jgi:putative hydrolases of HD superfamily
MDANISKVVSFLFEMGTLRKILRSHRQTLLTDDLSDNIASHSFRVTMTGMILANLEKADANKVMRMCIFHDIAESRSGDQNWVNKSYVKVYEDEINKSQIENLPNEKEIKEIVDEYNKRETKEAKIAKDADLLDQIFLLSEYAWAGNNEAKRWLEDGKGGEAGKRLFSESAKNMVKEIYSQRPSLWFDKIWQGERR